MQGAWLATLLPVRHVKRLPLQVPLAWTGQPGRTTGLERLGFYGDSRVAVLAGLWAALRDKSLVRLASGCRTTLHVHARPLGRRAALRTGSPGCAARRTNYCVTAPLDQRTDRQTTSILFALQQAAWAVMVPQVKLIPINILFEHF